MGMERDKIARRMEKAPAEECNKVQRKLKEKPNNATVKALINYQFKTNIIQYISAGIMFVAGIVISFVNKNGIVVTIGSLVQGDTTVSNITINLGALLILGGFYIFITSIKNSNTKFKQK